MNESEETKELILNRKALQEEAAKTKCKTLKIPNSFAQTANAPARIKTDLRIPQPHYQHLYHLHQLHSFM